MARDAKSYELFIAAPSDVVNEKEIIKNLCEEWNKLQGRFKNARIETRDWGNAYPMIGNRPQAIINEQIFDESDFVVAIFWTKFGMPTGEADSGTEEEILRAHQLDKPLLLYFSDAMKPPSQINHSEHEKVLNFKKNHQPHGLYSVFNDEEEFKTLFREHLSNFMNDLLDGKFEKNKEFATAIAVSPKKAKKQEGDVTGAKYKPVGEVEKLIKKNFKIYWQKLFGIVETDVLPNGIKFSKSNNEELKILKEKITEWEKRIINYNLEFEMQFLSRFGQYDEDEFKNEIFAKFLWTVKGALKNPDVELRRYKSAFKNVDAFQIKEVASNIIEVGKQYQINPPAKVVDDRVLKPEELDFEVLLRKQTLLNNIIGKGIRSEILHKAYPGLFALMTRRSIWGLFFLSEESEEFIVDQKKEGMWRTVHNWDYLYEYFNYYNLVVYRLIVENVSKHKINLKAELKYGYANVFLVDVFTSEAKEIENLRRYKNIGI